MTLIVQFVIGIFHNVSFSRQASECLFFLGRPLTHSIDHIVMVSVGYWSSVSSIHQAVMARQGHRSGGLYPRALSLLGSYGSHHVGGSWQVESGWRDAGETRETRATSAEAGGIVAEREATSEASTHTLVMGMLHLLSHVTHASKSTGSHVAHVAMHGRVQVWWREGWERFVQGPQQVVHAILPLLLWFCRHLSVSGLDPILFHCQWPIDLCKRNE